MPASTARNAKNSVVLNDALVSVSRRGAGRWALCRPSPSVASRRVAPGVVLDSPLPTIRLRADCGRGAIAGPGKDSTYVWAELRLSHGGECGPPTRPRGTGRPLAYRARRPTPPTDEEPTRTPYQPAA